MLVKSEAIVLGSVKYGDSSIILKTYTAEEGLKSFICGGLQTKKGPLRPSMVQPLSQLSLVYYSHGKGGLRRLKEASVAQPYQNLYFEPVKSTLAMFLAEVLGHVLHEEETNPELYVFLSQSLKNLDELQKGMGNFHLLFLFQLTEYLGFAPEKIRTEGVYFDLLNGIYSKTEPSHFHFLPKDLTPYWQRLQAMATDNNLQLSLNQQGRERLLRALLEYYRLHVKDFGELRSLDILKELLA